MWITLTVLYCKELSQSSQELIWVWIIVAIVTLSISIPLALYYGWGWVTREFSSMFCSTLALPFAHEPMPQRDTLSLALASPLAIDCCNLLLNSCCPGSGKWGDIFCCSYLASVFARHCVPWSQVWGHLNDLIPPLVAEDLFLPLPQKQRVVVPFLFPFPSYNVSSPVPWRCGYLLPISEQPKAVALLKIGVKHPGKASCPPCRGGCSSPLHLKGGFL